MNEKIQDLIKHALHQHSEIPTESQQKRGIATTKAGWIILDMFSFFSKRIW